MASLAKKSTKATETKATATKGTKTDTATETKGSWQPPTKQAVKDEYPAILTGHLGGDPEMRFTPNGNAVTSFSLALYAGKDQQENKLTEWVKVTVWKELAERVNQAFGKGDKVEVSGLIQVDMWEGNDGEIHSRVNCTAFQVVKIVK